MRARLPLKLSRTTGIPTASVRTPGASIAPPATIQVSQPQPVSSELVVRERGRIGPGGKLYLHKLLNQAARFKKATRTCVKSHESVSG